MVFSAHSAHTGKPFHCETLMVVCRLFRELFEPNITAPQNRRAPNIDIVPTLIGILVENCLLTHQ